MKKKMFSNFIRIKQFFMINLFKEGHFMRYSKFYSLQEKKILLKFSVFEIKSNLK